VPVASVQLVKPFAQPLLEARLGRTRRASVTCMFNHKWRDKAALTAACTGRNVTDCSSELALLRLHCKHCWCITVQHRVRESCAESCAQCCSGSLSKPYAAMFGHICPQYKH
jgi:hypothetical protein